MKEAVITCFLFFLLGLEPEGAETIMDELEFASEKPESPQSSQKLRESPSNALFGPMKTPV